MAHIRTQVWGVLNVTPDSFSDGGRYEDVNAAIAHARAMVENGADVVDVGGASSRPPGKTYGAGADAVSPEEEARRVVPVVERLVDELDVRVSVDTVTPSVAEAALASGAGVVNDISGGHEPGLLEAAARADADLVLMHNRGRGEREGTNVRYGDVVVEVLDALLEATERAQAAGVAAERLWIDPGVGFAKNAFQSVELIANLRPFVESGYPVLVGSSRKSFIAEVAAGDGAPAPADQRLGGTAATVAQSVLAGARAVRVHDVKVMVQAVRVADAMKAARRVA